jgi:hypothetical protein
MNALLKARLQKLEQRLDNGNNDEEFDITPEMRLAVGKALYTALDITDFNARLEAVRKAFEIIPCRRTRPYTAAEQAALVDEYHRLTAVH